MFHLKPGDAAPAFEGIDQQGQKVKLADYKGKKLVIYFYPQDDTPTCTVEACNLRDNYQVLKDKGLEILGVSPDGIAKHQKFINKYELPFSLLADEDNSIMDAYGVWGPKKFMGKEYIGVHRTTFVVDEAGKIMHVIEKVKSKEHSQQILELLAK